MQRLAPYLLAPLVALVVPRPAPAAEMPAAAPRAQTVRRVLPASVRIQVYSGSDVRRSATGVVVQSEPGKAGAHGRSLILTNAHVADPSELKDVTYKVLVERHGRVERTLTARLGTLGHVPEMDLATLEVDEQLPAVELGREDAVDVGDEVVVVGAPYGRSLSVSGGMVSQIEAAEAADEKAPLAFTAMKTDAAIGYGSSGGGVFAVPSGKLLGIVEGYRTARVNINEHSAFDVPMPGETFVAPITKLRHFLADASKPALTASNAESAQSGQTTGGGSAKTASAPQR